MFKLTVVLCLVVICAAKPKPSGFYGGYAAAPYGVGVGAVGLGAVGVGGVSHSHSHSHSHAMVAPQVMAAPIIATPVVAPVATHAITSSHHINAAPVIGGGFYAAGVAAVPSYGVGIHEVHGVGVGGIHAVHGGIVNHLG